MSPLDSRSNFHLSNVGLCVWLFSWQLAVCNKKKNLQRQQLKLSKIIFTYPANTYWKHVWYDKWKHLIIYLKVIDFGQGRQLQITTFQITFLIQIIFFEKNVCIRTSVCTQIQKPATTAEKIFSTLSSYFEIIIS